VTLLVDMDQAPYSDSEIDGARDVTVGFVHSGTYVQLCSVVLSPVHLTEGLRCRGTADRPLWHVHLVDLALLHCSYPRYPGWMANRSSWIHCPELRFSPLYRIPVTVAVLTRHRYHDESSPNLISCLLPFCVRPCKGSLLMLTFITLVPTLARANHKNEDAYNGNKPRIFPKNKPYGVMALSAVM
jgi:hypothetical protein